MPECHSICVEVIEKILAGQSVSTIQFDEVGRLHMCVRLKPDDLPILSFAQFYGRLKLSDGKLVCSCILYLTRSQGNCFGD